MSVPLRAAPVLASTAKVTVPLPEPADPVWTVIHGASLDALHSQPAVLRTVTLSLPADEPTESVNGSTWNEQPSD